MVRRRQDAGAAGDRGGARAQDRVRAGAMGSDLLQLDGQHPAVVHFPANLVGPSNSGVVRAGRQDLRRRECGRCGGRRAGALHRDRGDHRRGGPRHRRRSGAARALCERVSASRRRRARHLVLFGAVAVLDLGLAGRDAGAQALLSDLDAGHRLRHHLLLGRAHDDDGAAFHERGAVPRRLYPRAGARRLRRQDVEVEGQRHRSAGSDRRVRRRRLALHARGHGGAGPRHQALGAARRGLPQFRDQTLERGALCRDQRLRPRSGFRSAPRQGDAQPLDRPRDREDGQGGHGGDRGLQIQRGGERDLSLCLECLLRLVSRTDQAGAHRPRRRRQDRDARGRGVGAR